MSRARALLAAVVVAGLATLPVEAQEFGYNVVLDGETLLISEPVDPSGTGPDGTPGTLYVYSRTGSGWEKSGTLQAPDASGADFFGRSVILDGDRLIVGSTARDPDGDGQSDGNVLIFNRSGDGWEFESFLRPESVPMGSSYGRFASLADDLLVVTALGANNSGAAWIFERDASGDWVESGMVTPAEPDPQQEFFGWGVHTDGERVIVGAFAGQQIPGAGYIFGRDDSGEWVQEAKLGLPADESQPGAYTWGGNPGAGVAISGDYAILGLPGVDNGAGEVLMYERRSTGDWVRTGSLAAFDRTPGAGFGAAFGGQDNELWVAAPGAGIGGAIYRFAWDAENETFASATKILSGPGSDSGDGFGMSMVASGDIAVIGQPYDDSRLGSVVVLENDAGEWMETAKLFIPEERRALASLSDVECGEDGMADQFTCGQVDILSFLPLDEIGGTDRGIETNDVWGWTHEQTGREFALVGRTDGTAFIEISDPQNPVYLGNLAKTPGSITNSWRDIKVYDDHAFIVADGAGQHGMQVFDLARLLDVRNAPVEFTPDALYENVASVHNIVINEGSGTAYAVGSNSGGETCGGGLHMIDIRTPTDPTFLGCFQDVDGVRETRGYSHDAMCIMYDGPDTEHAGKEICFGSNETELSIADVSDKDNPIALSNATYPNVAYAHQGWITPDHSYFFMNDEGDEGAAEAGQAPAMPGTRTLIWDVRDLDDPVMVKEHFGETLTIDHNLYIVDDLMYQSNYVSGLRILDISDPENPVEVGYLDTVPWDESVTFDGSWSNYPFFASGTVVVSSGKEGVFFLKYSPEELVP